jgi:hypothetical protein
MTRDRDELVPVKGRGACRRREDRRRQSARGLRWRKPQDRLRIASFAAKLLDNRWYARRKVVYENTFQSPLSTHCFVDKYIADLERTIAPQGKKE